MDWPTTRCPAWLCQGAPGSPGWFSPGTKTPPTPSSGRLKQETKPFFSGNFFSLSCALAPGFDQRDFKARKLSELQSGNKEWIHGSSRIWLIMIFYLCTVQSCLINLNLKTIIILLLSQLEMVCVVPSYLLWKEPFATTIDSHQEPPFTLGQKFRHIFLATFFVALFCVHTCNMHGVALIMLYNNIVVAIWSNWSSSWRN